MTARVLLRKSMQAVARLHPVIQIEVLDPIDTMALLQAKDDDWSVGSLWEPRDDSWRIPQDRGAVVTRTVRLSDLDAEIITYSRGPAVWFRCPICPDGDKHHVLPYGPGEGQRWTHQGGSTIDDLTVSPSYLARCPRPRKEGAMAHCRLHAFIRNGVVEILSDSGMKDGPVTER